MICFEFFLGEMRVFTTKGTKSTKGGRQFSHRATGLTERRSRQGKRELGGTNSKGLESQRICDIYGLHKPHSACFRGFSPCLCVTVRAVLDSYDPWSLLSKTVLSQSHRAHREEVSTGKARMGAITRKDRRAREFATFTGSTSRILPVSEDFSASLCRRESICPVRFVSFVLFVVNRISEICCCTTTGTKHEGGINRRSPCQRPSGIFGGGQASEIHGAHKRGVSED